MENKVRLVIAFYESYFVINLNFKSLAGKLWPSTLLNSSKLVHSSIAVVKCMNKKYLLTAFCIVIVMAKKVIRITNDSNLHLASEINESTKSISHNQGKYFSGSIWCCTIMQLSFWQQICSAPQFYENLHLAVWLDDANELVFASKVT